MAQSDASQGQANGSRATVSRDVGTGVDIEPIPAAVEFPFPTTHSSSPHESEQTPELPATTPKLLEQTKTFPARPTQVQRAATAKRPLARTRESLMGLKRTNTMVAPKVFDPSLWDSDSDSSSAGEVRSGIKKTHSAPLRSGARVRDGPGDPYRRFAIGNQDYSTSGKVSKRDGRLNIKMREGHKKGYLAKTLGETIRHRLDGQDHESEEPEERSVRPQLQHAGTLSTLDSVASQQTTYYPEKIPKLNIVIMVIGSRGDIQPFLRLGKVLKEEHGHRVRIATHPAFREFVEQDTDLEFFSVGGDPAELMAFMVKNPGLIPKAKTIREGEIAKRREAMYEMFTGFWRACINTTDDEHDIANIKMMGRKNPFVADAIIANPPSFAHIHCAERLGVPLHLMFTFPTTPTQQFPHPLANVKQSNVDRNYTNFMSYPLVDMMTWQGLGDLVNRFRVKSLGLEPISTLWAPGQIFRMRVPHTYMISPALLPKPDDWGPEIDVTGFVFLDLASSFEPPQELIDFLNAGEPPVYIGFGSIVVDDPERFTTLVFDSVKKAGVRALVSQGWGGLGADADVPDNVFLLGNTPHDWLFPRVSAVVHHGGAGTTAIGLKCGKPTMVVPFFGDQAFWGSMIHKAGAGAQPVPYKHLTVDVLAESIRTLLTSDCLNAAKKIAEQIEAEGDGAENAVNSFHRALPLRGNHSMRCSILDDKVAVWWLKGTHIRLSALAAEILVQSRRIDWTDLNLVRHYDWNDFEGPGEPLTGAGGALARNVVEAARGVGGTPSRWKSTIQHRHDKDRNLDTARKSNTISERSNEKSKAMELDQSNPEVEKRDSEAKMPSGQINPGAGEAVLAKKLSKENQSEASAKQAVESTMKQNSVPTKAAVLAAAEDLDNTHLASGLVAGTGKGVAKTARALARAPVDISLALAQGFHNAPRLWGDETVRTPRRVVGMRSALGAARDEFAYGVYDGVTGLVRHPYHGAKEGGALGFTKGLGKGVGGFVLKDIAAVAGIPAYTLKGIQKEIKKQQQPTNFIRRAQLIEGQKELTMLSKEDLHTITEKIAAGWRIIVAAMEKKVELEQKGIAGRLFVHRTRKKWKKHGVFESVEQIQQALNADREGRDFQRTFKHHRRELKRANQFQMPRESSDDRRKSRTSPKSATTKDNDQRLSLERVLRGTEKSSETKRSSIANLDGGGDVAGEQEAVSNIDFQPSSRPKDAPSETATLQAPTRVQGDVSKSSATQPITDEKRIELEKMVHK